MQWIKIVVGASNLLLLFVGGVFWLWGSATKKPARKHLGNLLLSAWLIYDLACILLAYSLGWFA